ncbi:MAG TPA: HAMP domain-containing sensor histidine kinase [Kofleriaceae bacterium]|nr:HAMP domain-containing sensor histidine kinase [Kofleriaceae bacterium]
MTTIRRGFALIGGAVLLLILGSIVVLLVVAMNADREIARARREAPAAAAVELAAADRDDQLVTRMALIEVALLVTGGAAAAVLVHRTLHRPLVELESTIARFDVDAGRGVRAAEQGPQEIRRIARTFNRMADELARREQRESIFLAGVAHDLRNPLTVIRGSVELVLDAERMAPDQRRRALERTVRQIDAMDRLLGDFLDARSIQSGRLALRPERHDLCRLAVDVTELFRLSAHRHDISIDVPAEPVFARCDGVRLEQVLVNLLSNAIKYSPDGGAVTVAVRDGGDHGTLVVADEGVGIPADEVDGIFEPFHRASSHARSDIPGTGLGLSTVRRIVEAHGGRIELDSEPGRGTTFRVIIPTASADADRRVAG